MVFSLVKTSTNCRVFSVLSTRFLRNISALTHSDLAGYPFRYIRGGMGHTDRWLQVKKNFLPYLNFWATFDTLMFDVTKEAFKILRECSEQRRRLTAECVWLSAKTGSNIGQNGILMGTAYISESRALKKAKCSGRSQFLLIKIVTSCHLWRLRMNRITTIKRSTPGRYNKKHV